jgi:hypothetical protein
MGKILGTLFPTLHNSYTCALKFFLAPLTVEEPEIAHYPASALLVCKVTLTASGSISFLKEMSNEYRLNCEGACLRASPHRQAKNAKGVFVGDYDQNGGRRQIFHPVDSSFGPQVFRNFSVDPRLSPNRA